jgi:hypothetical protein
MNKLTLALVIGIVSAPFYYYHLTEKQGAIEDPTSIESAKEKIIGIWTYTDPVDVNGQHFPFWWEKLDIRNDGTLTIWTASPTDDNWGDGETRSYEAVTGKYSDTGKRWFGLKIKDTYHSIIYSNGYLVLHSGQDIALMQRGDKNPFSQ